MSDINEFFGNGTPPLGTYEVPPVGAINDLTDVTITAPVNDQHLVYQSGFWINQTLTLVENLADLADVNLTGIANDYILVWDSGNSEWVVESKNSLTSLSSLSDVTIGSPSVNHVLKYDGVKWVNGQLDYSSLSSTPAIPTNNSFSFLGLSDTDNPAVADGYLKWNSGGTSVEYVTTIPASSITGLSSVATLGTLDSLTDVVLTGPTNGQYLSFNGSNWVNISPSFTTDTIKDGDNNCYVAVNMVTDDIILQAGPTSGNIVLRTSGSGQVVLDGATSTDFYSTKPVSITVSGDDLILQNIIFPSTVGAVGEVMALVNTNELGFVPFSNVTVLENLTNVNYPSPPTNGQYLIYNSGTSDWESSDISLVINDITGVSTSALTNKDVLYYNGSNWINKQLAYTDISGTQPIPTMGIADLSNVYDLIAPTLKHVLYYDNANSRWDSKQLTYSDISGSIPNPTSLPLSGLSDVSDSLAPAPNHVLFYNSGTSTWISKKLSYNELSSLPALKTVATSGLYSDLTNAPFLPGGMAVNLNDLSDVNAPTPANNQYLQWSSGTSKWIPSTIPTVVTALSGLTTDVNVTSPTNNQLLKYDTATSKWVNSTITYTLDNLSDVVITAPASAQYIKYNGANWVNTSIAYADITGTPTLVSTLESLTNVQNTGFNTGDTIYWDGAEWVNYPIAGVEAAKITDGGDCFVDVSTNDDVTIQAGGVSSTGGNVTILANTTTNSNAAIIFGNIGTATNTVVSSDDPMNITAPSVSIQDIEYPAVDGNNGDVLITNGAGVLTFGPVPLPAEYLTQFKQGLEIYKSNNTEITVKVGICRDSTDTTSIEFNGIFAKTLSTWATGSGNGGAPASILPILNNSPYYVFVLGDGIGGVEVGFDTNVNATNLLAVSGSYSYYRMVGIIWTDSAGQVEGFTQIGNKFIMDFPKKIYTYSGTSPILNPSINVTTGLPNCVMDVIFNFSLSSPVAANEVHVCVGRTASIPSTVTDNNNVYFDYANTVKKSFKHTINNDMSFKMTSNTALSTLTMNLIGFTI